MNRARIRHDLERVRELPFFPALPLVPLALALGNLLMVGLVLRKVSKLEKLAYR